MRKPLYIDNQEAFEGFVQRASESPILAIDTEFMREKTYFAKLCLLQLGTPNEVAIVDPFAVRDLTPLVDLFLNPDVMKVFHAGSQDLEILYRCVGVMPDPVFDTQVAATLMGHTQQIGYASLVSAECGVQLKKADSFTDWTRRPLTQSQVKYAAEDVIYLPQIYRSMVNSLKKSNRLDWLQADFAELTDPDKYIIDVRERFRRLKRSGSLTRQQLSAARELAAWREERAMQRNVPRKWVLTDEQIVELCRRETRTVDELFVIRGVRDRLNIRDARTVTYLISKGLDLPPEEWPETLRSNHNEANVDGPVDLMNALVRLRSKEYSIAMQTLASHDDLANLARGHVEDLDLMRGWRKKLIGDELVDLLEGKISLRICDGDVQVISAEEPTCL